jgi:cytochrome c-type biogenesis protein
VSAAAALAVFGAGVASFLSPCVLSLVPAYVGAIAGAGTSSRSALRATVSFIAGFSTVFVVLGAVAGGVGGALADHDAGVARVGGLLVVVFGVVVLAARHGRLAGEWRVVAPVRRVGPVLTGIAFGAAWTPCVGPLLGASLVVATRDSAWQGAALLLAYSVGLGVPFLVAALALAAWPRRAAMLKRLTRWVEPAAGVVLVVIGLALATGWYTELISPLIPR